MKIIHIVIGKANPDRMNGVNKVVHHMAAQMKKNGQDVEVWGLTETPGEPTFKRDYPLHLFEVKAKSFAMNPLVAEAVDALPPGSVIHFHGGLIPAFYRVATYLKKKNISWIITPHAAYMRFSLRRRRLTKFVYLNTCEKFLLKNAKAVHVLTENEAQNTKDIYAHNSLVTIPNAYAFGEETKKDFIEIYAHSRPIFGYMGRLDKIHKGLDLLLSGFSQYIYAGGQGELWIVGEGPHEEHLRHDAEKRSITSNVRFWGARFGEEKANILKNAHVFVHTSRWEGMPMSLLEAAAHEKPLLISKDTGLAHEVNKARAGIVLEQNTASDIAKGLFQCYQLQKLGKLDDMGLQASEMVKNHFTWENIIQTMNEKLYKAA